MRKIKVIVLGLWLIPLLPHYVIFRFHKSHPLIMADIEMWKKLSTEYKKCSSTFMFFYLLARFKEFRNLFYKRIGFISYILKIYCRPMSTLYIPVENIGGGLVIQHGFSTIISAKSIGKNCWINQQVTIGYTNDTDCPTICDNVTISAGAIIVGKVTVHDNCHIGAGAVVVKDVPENCTVVGVPAYIIRRNGRKVHEAL